jgi:hypothetical protein
MIAPFAAGQALTPAEIKSPQMRALQGKYFEQLQTVAAEIQGHIFPYPFYFSRVLDLEMAQQERADQRSLRFDNYGGMTVVELTANYFGSYSVELVTKSHRAARTFNDVMLPALEIAMHELKDNPDVEGFAMEISHRIRGKAMGMNVEKAENLVLVLSKQAAIQLVEAKTDNDRQAAVLAGQFFYNGQPFVLYLSDAAAADAAKRLDKTDAGSLPTKDTATTKNIGIGSSGSSRVAPRAAEPAAPPRDTSPEALARIQTEYEKIIGVIVKETDPQAHFVSYARPMMVAFRKGAYLEFSVTTPLPGNASASRYKMAALAFDNHIAHLLRPIMGYLKRDLDFDGIAFSTTIHLPQKQDGSAAPTSSNTPQDKAKGKLPAKPPSEPKDKPTDHADDVQAEAAQGSEAVEFFFPVEALRCYETYDCTGQQLLDGSSVLVNGERVSLDLQIAEAGVQ